MIAFCSVNDVANDYSGFVRNATSSISDIQIEGYISNWAGRIKAALKRRGVDLATFEPDEDQEAVLRAINFAGASADLGLALAGQVTLQQASQPAVRRREAEDGLKEIAEGLHDDLFGVRTSGSLGGIGGAEVSAEDTPEALEENRSFGKNSEF